MSGFYVWWLQHFIKTVSIQKSKCTYTSHVHAPEHIVIPLNALVTCRKTLLKPVKLNKLQHTLTSSIMLLRKSFLYVHLCKLMVHTFYDSITPITLFAAPLSYLTFHVVISSVFLCKSRLDVQSQIDGFKLGQ